MKEDSTTTFPEQSTIIESAPYVLDDENAFPTLGGGQPLASNKKSEIETNSELIQKSNSKTYQNCLTDMFHALSTSTEIKSNTINNNSLDSKHEQTKNSKSTKFKRSINKDHEDNQQSLSKLTVEKQSDEKHIQNKTDTNITIE